MAGYSACHKQGLTVKKIKGILNVTLCFLGLKVVISFPSVGSKISTLVSQVKNMSNKGLAKCHKKPVKRDKSLVK